MSVPSFGVLEPSKAPADKVPGPETPFRIAILGDFSGRASRSELSTADELAKLKGVPVSVDTLEDVMARFKIAVQVPLPDDASVTLSLHSLDDFHPDEVHDKIAAFEDLDDDQDKSSLMKAVLHQSAFQDVEAAWRGVDWLLKRVHKTGSGMEVVLFDVGWDELSADLTAGDDLAQTGLYRALLAPILESAKAQPWALLVGLMTFDFTPEHIGILGRLARFAGVAAAPLLAAATPRVLRKDFELNADTAAAWDALRKLPEAALVGLVTPRYLMREPFGENTKSIDRFTFEEVDPRQSQAGYLWANPALGVACLLGQAFLRESWGFKTGLVVDLDDLPLHVWRDEDGDQQVTLAEVWLERKTTESLVKLGLMPFLSVRGKNTLQLFRFVALAAPPKGQPAVDLVGRWGQRGSLKVPRSVGVRGSGAVGLMSGDAPPPPAETATAEERAEEAPAEGASAEETPADAPAEEPAAPEAEEDPELAALLKQLEAPPAEEPAPEAAALAAEEADPELAALLQQLESGNDSPAPEAPAAEPEASAAERAPAEEEDPELAALMQQLETGGTAEAEPAPEAAPEPAAPEESPTPEPDADPELAALLGELESAAGAEQAAAEEPTPEPAAPKSTTPPVPAIDAELEALMHDLETTGDATEEPPPEASPPAAPDLQAEIDDLGGRAALDKLGWPVFAPAFMQDFSRLLRVLKGKLKNRAVDKEVAEHVKKCGGYPTLVNDGIRADLGLNVQLTKLRELRKALDGDALLKNAELEEMAETYGANLKKLPTVKAKSELLAQVREYDKWAGDARNADLAAALGGLPFKERRQGQLEQQLQALGGEAAFSAALQAHPAGLQAKSPPDTKIAVLKALKEYTKLGGDPAFVKQVGNDPKSTPLLTKLEQLKTVAAAQE